MTVTTTKPSRRRAIRETRRKDRAGRRTDQRSRNRLPRDRPRAARKLDRLLLNGRPLQLQAGQWLTDATMDRTIEGANTITLTFNDHTRSLLRSGVLGERAMAHDLRLELDDLAFIATAVSKSGDSLELTFEDETVTVLKRHGRNKPLRFPRSKWTRAEACAAMIRQAHVPLLVLDENLVQPIVGQRQLAREIKKTRRQQQSSRRQRDLYLGTAPPLSARRQANTRTTVSGLPGSWTIKGGRPSPEQRRNVLKVLTEAARYNPPEKALLAILVAGIAESEFLNVQGQGADRVSWGIFQAYIGVSRGYSTIAQGLDIPRNVKTFLVGPAFTSQPGAITLARRHPDWSAGQIAQTVEGSARPHEYDKHIEEARQILGFAKGNIDYSDSVSTIKVKEYSFERRKNESTWAACTRLLEEVRWRLFVREGVAVIASDTALFRAQAELEFDERTDTVDTIDFDWHRAAKVGEATVTAYVDRWQADPGDVAAATGLPPIARHWLVKDVTEPLIPTRPLAQISLIRPQKPAEEPAPEVDRSTNTISGKRATENLTIGTGDVAGLVFPLPTFGSISRLDRGVDMETKAPHGKIVAIGNARVLSGATDFPGIEYVLTDGPYRGWRVFHGHTHASYVHAGQAVKAGQIIGETGHQGESYDGGVTHIEIGFRFGPNGQNLGYNHHSGRWPSGAIGSRGAHEMYKLLKAIYPALGHPTSGYGPPGVL